MEITQKNDITGHRDVERLVRDFYTRVYKDEVLRPMFEEVAKIDLLEHLPKMNRFWNTVLFGEHSYKGNPMQIHLDLDQLKPLNDCHFVRWLSLFRLTVDELFSGPMAERAKIAAERVNKNIEWSVKRRRAAKVAELKNLSTATTNLSKGDIHL